MVSVMISAGRRTLAAFVLLIAGLLAVWAATFKVWWSIPAGIGGGDKADFNPAFAPLPKADCTVGGGLRACVGVSPAWTIPTAIAIAVIGLVVATMLYRPRGGAAEGRAVDLRRLSSADL
jgi:hypothetical protein